MITIIIIIIAARHLTRMKRNMDANSRLKLKTSP